MCVTLAYHDSRPYEKHIQGWHMIWIISLFKLILMKKYQIIIPSAGPSFPYPDSRPFGLATFASPLLSSVSLTQQAYGQSIGSHQLHCASRAKSAAAATSGASGHCHFSAPFRANSVAIPAALCCPWPFLSTDSGFGFSAKA